MAGGTPRPARSLGRVVVESVLAAALIVTFVVGGVAISGDSMEPTLRDGERAVVPRYETWLHRLGLGAFSRGDVVYFPSPEQAPGAICPWFCTHLIKRVVAVEGDTVAISDGRLYINGQPASEPYLGEGWRGSYSMTRTTVPPGHVFVLGDNRLPYGSFDSRAFGAVPEPSIEGRAAAVVWPLLRREHGRWRWNVRILDRGQGSEGASRPSSSSSAALACIASSTNCT